MEKTVKIIGILKWLCFPLGYIMFYFTSGSFGYIPGTVLSVAAIVGFWFLMRNEQTRLIGQTIATEIQKAIDETADVNCFIEIKRLKNGMIARIYLINAKDLVSDIHRSVNARMEKCVFKKYLWIMQLTDMPNMGAIRETRKILNDQLLDEIMKKRDEKE